MLEIFLDTRIRRLTPGGSEEADMPQEDLVAIAIHGATIGAIAGLAPMLAGLVKKQNAFACGALVTSICTGAIFGPWIAVPLALILTVVVLSGASSFRLSNDGGGAWGKQQKIIAGSAIALLVGFIVAVLVWWLFD